MYSHFSFSRYFRKYYITQQRCYAKPSEGGKIADIDNSLISMLNYTYCPEHVLFMVQDDNQKNQNEVLIKFLAPSKLKHALEELAAERNISLSALLRLVTSEYVRRNDQI